MVSIFLFAMRQKIESHALLMSAKFSDDRYERIFLQLYGRMCFLHFAISLRLFHNVYC